MRVEPRCQSDRIARTGVQPDLVDLIAPAIAILRLAGSRAALENDVGVEYWSVEAIDFHALDLAAELPYGAHEQVMRDGPFRRPFRMYAMADGRRLVCSGGDGKRPQGNVRRGFDARSLKTMADGMGPDAMTMLSMSTRIMVHSVTRSTFGMSGGVEVSGGSMFENPDVHVARGLASRCRLCTSMAPRVQPLYSFAAGLSREVCRCGARTGPVRPCVALVTILHRFLARKQSVREWGNLEGGQSVR